jgi:hypothetical protein
MVHRTRPAGRHALGNLLHQCNYRLDGESKCTEGLKLRHKTLCYRVLPYRSPGTRSGRTGSGIRVSQLFGRRAFRTVCEFDQKRSSEGNQTGHNGMKKDKQSVTIDATAKRLPAIDTK